MDTPDTSAVQDAVGDRYEVLDLAGVGGMGVVYRARHRQLGHLVAIKVLPPEVAESNIRQQRFKREAALAAHLSHPNIVPVYEFERRESISFLIMPFVRGRSLESVLAEGAHLTPGDVLRLLGDVGAALDFVHPRGVIHRDVKPANILIEAETGRALLTDFGVASVSSATDESLTGIGIPIGTPDYMAPEQAIGRRVDGRADLYALAIVAYEAMTGNLPQLASSPDVPAGALHAARPEIATRLATALLAPLAAQPGDRPATAAQWIAAIRRAGSGARRQAALWVAAVAVALLVLGAIALRRHHAPGPPSVAVMPFTVLGQPPYPIDQLPEFFLSRFSPVPRLAAAISFGRVHALTGPRPVTGAEADSIARLLQVKYFVNASLAFQGREATLSASLFQTGRRGPRATVSERGPIDSLTAVMDAAWAAILGAEFRPNPYATIPRGKEAIAAYLNADEAFRHADYAAALALYDSVTRRDSGFAPAYLRRLLVLAQVAPQEDSMRAAMRSARRHAAGLTPSDSLLLDGYVQLVERGDGVAALERFREASGVAADRIWARFTLGEFYLYFGQLFDQPLDSARAAFDDVLALEPRFAAAIANSISLAHLRGDDAEARRLIREYRRIDSTSVVAEVIGLADTLLFQAPTARVAVLNSLNRRAFTVLEYLAFQAAQFGTEAERRGPARRALAALERRAATSYERTLALRLGLAADLREGWVDSARARLAEAGAAAPERDAWLILARATGLPALGDWEAARRRALTRGGADSSATQTWLLGMTAERWTPHVRALERLAARDSSPLAWSLARDLEGRSLLARGDTTAALARWDDATRRYAVIAAPFGLVASLWPTRRELVRIAAQRGDTARVVRGCRSFDALVGYVDQVVWPEMQRVCAPWRGWRAP